MVGKLPDFLFNNEYVITELYNIHLRKDAPKELVEKMKKFRMEYYGDENVYGEKDYKGIKVNVKN